MRHERDFYPTPQSIIDCVLFHVKLREDATVWEPCAGDGRFSTAPWDFLTPLSQPRR